MSDQDREQYLSQLTEKELIALVQQALIRSTPRDEAEDRQIHLKESTGVVFTWYSFVAVVGALVAAIGFYFHLTNQLREMAEKLDKTEKKLEQAVIKDDIRSHYISLDWMRAYLEYCKDNNPTLKVPSVEYINRQMP